MSKTEELELFLSRADEFVDSKYILADVKIVNLLKAIASSETLLALFKNCLNDFDYEKAKERYLVKSPYLSEDKGEFVLPSSSREILAFTFCILMDIDSKKIDISDFIKKYFFENGSFSESYSSFINSMIKPFRNTVKVLIESVIEGKLQDPVEAFTIEEKKRQEKKEEERKKAKLAKELSEKTYASALKKVKELLFNDKTAIKDSRLKEDVKKELTLIVDMLANVIEGDDKDAVEYAFVSYKFVTYAHPVLFFKRVKQLSPCIEDILNGI